MRQEKKKKITGANQLGWGKKTTDGRRGFVIVLFSWEGVNSEWKPIPGDEIFLFWTEVEGDTWETIFGVKQK